MYLNIESMICKCSIWIKGVYLHSDCVLVQGKHQVDPAPHTSLCTAMASHPPTSPESHCVTFYSTTILTILSIMFSASVWSRVRVMVSE